MERGAVLFWYYRSHEPRQSLGDLRSVCGPDAGSVLLDGVGRAAGIVTIDKSTVAAIALRPRSFWDSGPFCVKLNSVGTGMK